MDGSRRVDVNLYLNNNHQNNHYDYNHQHQHHNYDLHNRNNAPSVPSSEGIHIACLDHHGHSYMSLLLQPSPLRTTPDIHLNFHHGWNNNEGPNYHSGSGLGFLEDRPMGQGMDYVHGPFQSNVPFNEGHISPQIPPFGNTANSIAPHYYEPVTMMEEDELVPYSSSQLALFDGVDYRYPPNSHYSATSGAPSAGDFERGGSGPRTTEIMFGGRVIQATPVELTPVMPPTFVRYPETAISAPPMGHGLSGAPSGLELMFSHSQGVAATQDIREHPGFPGGDLNHLVAAQQSAQHDPNPITSWEVNVNPHYIQNYSDFLQGRFEHGSANSEERERLPPSEAGDGPEDVIIDDEDIYVELQDWSYEAMIALEERLGTVSTGLTERQILDVLRRERFHPNSPDGDVPSCSICLEDFQDEEELGIMARCSHEFHFECIKSWLSRKNTCPLCREVV